MILKGDCIEVMKAMKPNSVDAVVCDPPYGLEFMGKEWDKLRNTWQAEKGRYHNNTTFIAKGDRIRYQAGLEMQLWHTQWLTEAYRVLKPGGSMLVMGGTRTSHRLACAIEDSGFIIKDTLAWMYGAGFPKCQDITPHIDAKILGITTKQVKERRRKVGKSIHSANRKETSFHGAEYKKGITTNPEGERYITKPLTSEAKHWDGFKVGGIKPAYEPILWAVRPPEGSYVDNVLKWGVSAVNVDECRIGYQNNGDKNWKHKDGKIGTQGYQTKYIGGKQKYISGEMNTKGRFPANVILSHHPECVQVGTKRVRGSHDTTGAWGTNKQGSSFRGYGTHGDRKQGHVDPNGYEQVESWDCHPDCAVFILDQQSGVLKSGGGNKPNKRPLRRESQVIETIDNTSWKQNSGNASRFFYCAKASRAERNAGLDGMENKPIALNTGNAHNVATLGRETKHKNNHPTVKPIRLFEWLIKLVTREGQIILDPFIGSGTTAIAAHNTGRKCVGIEKEDEYLEIAKRRIDYWERQPKQMEIRT